MIIEKPTKTLSKLWLLVALAGMAGIFVVGQLQTAGAQPKDEAKCPKGYTWSNWLDRDDPSGKGDYEDLKSLIKEGKIVCPKSVGVQCRYKGPPGTVWGQEIVGSSSINPSQAGYNCKYALGGWCVNSNTTPKGSCRDSEVRFCCSVKK